MFRIISAVTVIAANTISNSPIQRNLIGAQGYINTSQVRTIKDQDKGRSLDEVLREQIGLELKAVFFLIIYIEITTVVWSIGTARN